MAAQAQASNRVALGIVAALLTGWAGFCVYVDATKPGPPPKWQPPPAAAPASPAAATDPRLDLVRFLQRMDAFADAADKACFRATRCGYVAPDGDRGEAPSIAAIPACVEERLVECALAVRTLRSASPPPDAAADWLAWVDARYADYEPELRAILAILAERAPPAVLRANGETFDGIIDWGSAAGVKAARAYIDARPSVFQDPNPREAAEAALLARLPGVCNEGSFCTVGKIMHGAPASVGAPFWRLRQ